MAMWECPRCGGTLTCYCPTQPTKKEEAITRGFWGRTSAPKAGFWVNGKDLSKPDWEEVARFYDELDKSLERIKSDVNLIKEIAMTEFDPSKPVMTRDGRSARVLCTDRISGEGYSLAALQMMNGIEVTSFHSADGSSAGGYPNHPWDLVNIPESKWMNIYEDPNITLCWLDSKEAADHAAAVRGSRRIAVTEWTASSEFITTAVEK